MTDLPFDILDHIFGLLRSDPKSLIACSKAHPDFTPIVEKHRYYHTIVHARFTIFPYTFKPIRLMKLISASPSIVRHIRVLEIEFNNRLPSDLMNRFLEDIAWLLPRFPAIECLMLSTEYTDSSWSKLSKSFIIALEDCLHLPTLRELHVGQSDFPLSLLDEHTNINLLSLSENPQITEYLDTTYPQLKSLSVAMTHHCGPFITWANPRIGNLQTLEFYYLDDEIFLNLLESCSGTLENLYINFVSSSSTFATTYYLETGEVERYGTPTSMNLSSLRHLQFLVIRITVYLETRYLRCVSFLPALIEIIKTASLLRNLRLAIGISIPFIIDVGLLNEIDFSPLTALTEFCAPFLHIDFYIHSECAITLSTVILFLADYKCLMKLIDKGFLVIHAGETAPRFLDMHSRSTLVQRERFPYIFPYI